MKKNLFRLAAVLVVLALFFACSSNTVYYTVSYEPNGGSYVASEQVPSGGKATAPVAPTKSGYTFDGWYEDAEFTIAFDFETKIYKSYKLYAKWTENKPEPQPEPPIPPVPAGDEVTFVARGIETETKAVTADDYFLTFKRDGSANGYIDDKKFTTTWKVTSDGMFIAIDGDDFGVVSTMNPEEEGDELIWSFDELCLCGVIYLRSETGLYSDMNFVNEEVAEVTYSVAFNKGLYGPAGVNNPDTQVVLRGGSAMQPEGGIWDRVVCWQTKDGNKWYFSDPMESDLVLYAKWNLVGGSIFYVDNTSTDATYTFYDEKGNVLSTQTVEGLDGAFCYSVNGTPSKDKFYVAEKKEVVTKCTSGASGGVRKFDGTNYCVWAAGNDNELDSSKIEVLNGYGDSKIGAGKKNTAWIFANRNNSDYFPNGVVETGPGSGKYYYTCWDFCKYCRDNSVNGCDDWFVPSIAECKALRESKIWGDTNSDWVSTTCYVDERSYLWSSSAGSYAGYAWYWRVSSSASFANCYRRNYQSDDRFLAVVRAF